MKEVIGFNLICFVVSFIVVMISDLRLKEKIIGMIMEVVMMAVLSIGAGLLVGF